VPRAVIAEARRYLEQLETERDRQRAAGQETAGAQAELPLFAAAKPDPLREALAAIDPDALSPRAALEALYALRRVLDS
jgi:DNA mismatch repair protein MutS